MPDNRWKRHERVIAFMLGGQRQPNTGRPSPDVTVPGLAVEVKTRKQLPKWLTEAIEQAQTNAAKDCIPLVVLVLAPGQGVKARRYAFLKLEDFMHVGSERP